MLGYLKKAEKELKTDFSKNKQIKEKLIYYINLIIITKSNVILWKEIFDFYDEFFGREEFFEVVTLFIKNDKIKINFLNNYNQLKEFYIKRKDFKVN